MVELKVNMRQQNDTSFSQMLNRIRKGDQTHEDVKAIQGRLVSNGDIDLSAAPFDTALRLYPCTASMDEYNESQIASLAQTTKLYTFEAEHAILQSRGQFYANVQYNEVPERLIPQDDKECAALPRRLKLAVGARVMLRRNINCGDGLVNEPSKVKANKRVHEEMERLTGPQLRILQSHCVHSGGSSQVEEMEVEE